MRDHTKVADITKGLKVEIESRDGLIIGLVDEVLTNRDNPKGIKVKIEGGASGRICKVLEKQTENKPPKDIKTEIKNTTPTIKEIKNNTVINIADNDILAEVDIGKKSTFPVKQYVVTTKFYKAVYCKKVHDELKGTVIFKVQGENINICIYKINKFLKKFCINKDIKYEVIKVEER